MFLTKLSTSMLVLTAHCNVPIMFMANVRIMPTLPSPLPISKKCAYVLASNYTHI